MEHPTALDKLLELRELPQLTLSVISRLSSLAADGDSEETIASLIE